MSKVAVLGSRHVPYIYNLHLATIKHLSIHVCVGRYTFLSMDPMRYPNINQSLVAFQGGKIISGNEGKGVHLTDFLWRKTPHTNSRLERQNHLSLKQNSLQFFVVLQTCFA